MTAPSPNAGTEPLYSSSCACRRGTALAMKLANVRPARREIAHPSQARRRKPQGSWSWDTRAKGQNKANAFFSVRAPVSRARMQPGGHAGSLLRDFSEFTWQWGGGVTYPESPSKGLSEGKSFGSAAARLQSFWPAGGEGSRILALAGPSQAGVLGQP